MQTNIFVLELRVQERAGKRVLHSLRKLARKRDWQINAHCQTLPDGTQGIKACLVDSPQGERRRLVEQYLQARFRTDGNTILGLR